MPKEIVNNRINYANFYGRIIQHDLLINQGVKNDDSPTFANLQLTGDATIQGNLYVEGNTTILNTNAIEFKDNIILINDTETGAGVTLNQAGIEVERGSLENYRFVWDEISETFRVGVISNLEPLTIREDYPLNNGLMFWNNFNKRIEARNHFDIDLTQTSLTDSTSSDTGAIAIGGGLGVGKNMFINGSINLVGTDVSNKTSIWTDLSTNSFNIHSVQDINLVPLTKVTIPYDIPLIFGTNNQAIIADGTSTDLSIYAHGNINLTPGIGRYIIVPNQIPIMFSTTNEKLYTDGSNNMVMESSKDIILKPANGAGGRRVLVPVDTPIVFSNNNQQIVSNFNNDLSINAGNNILLNPGPTLNVRIPTDNGLKFGGSGNQLISANSNNELNILSSGDIYLTPTSGNHINIPSNIPLTFGGYSQNIVTNTNGTLFINAANKLQVTPYLHVSNTTDTTCATIGSIRTDGGLGVAKNINCENSIIINSQNSDALTVKNPTTNTVLQIDVTNSGKMTLIAGSGTSSNPSLLINSLDLFNAKSLIQLTSGYDSTLGYMIGRGRSNLNSGRVFTVNIPSWTSYGSSGSIPKFSITSNDTNTELFSIQSDSGNATLLGTINIQSTQDATSPTSAGTILSGGLGIKKSIYTSGKYISSINSTEALSIKNAGNAVIFNIDTVNNVATFNENVLINNQNTNAFSVNIPSGSVFNIDTTATPTITNSCINNYINTSDSTDTSSGSVVMNGGVAIQKTLNVGGVVNTFNGINMQNTKINNLIDPSLPQDAATKAYVDLVKQGLFVKDSVQVATVTAKNFNTEFAAGSVIDNYTLVLGDRILIKNQANGIQNGIYTVTSGAPTRTLDLQNGVHAAGTFVFVEKGDTNGSLGWICNSSNANDIVGSSVLSYTQFTALGQVTAGDALSKEFNTMNVNVDNYSIEIVNDQLRLSSSDISTGLLGGSGVQLTTDTDQSHVTKLGTINTGVWQGSNIGVGYGGTGRSFFNPGNVLFGNGANGISYNSKLYFDPTNARLGLGTNNPSYDLNMKSPNTNTLAIEADSDANNANAKPQIKFTYAGGQNISYIGMTRNNNEYATGVYPDALVISNDQVDGTSCIQLATNRVSQMTILSNGNIGIQNSTPLYNLDLNGTLNVTGRITFDQADSSINATDASVVITGGVSIACTANSQSQYEGGALTVDGGVAIRQDLYVGGQINGSGSSSSTFAYLTLTATDESINLTSGALITFGGITIQCSTNATSYTNGGGLLVIGGASIGQSVYIGKTLNVYKDAFLNSLYITSNSTSSFIESPNNSRVTGSFNPIYYTKYSNTAANIITIHSGGLILNTNGSLQIGGSLANPDGYSLTYNSVNKDLNFFPNNISAGNANATYNLNIGTSGSLSNINVYGYNSGKVSWQSTSSNLLLTSMTTQLNNVNVTSNSIIITTPNTSGSSFIKANNTTMTLNLGQNSTGGQLITVLSNNVGDSTVTFTPSNVSSSTLVLTNNVYSTYNGPTSFTDRVEYAGNALHQTVNNTSGNSLWVYFGKINTTTNGINEKGYCEIDFVCGTNQSSGNTLSGLRFQASINGTTCSASHLHYGSLLFNSLNKPVCYIYKDTSNNHQLFVLTAPNSQTNINVTSQVGTKFLLLNEGVSSSPNGSSSGYSVSWSEVYVTNVESSLPYTFGDVTIEGKNLQIADNLPIIGYNNKFATNSRDIGILFQRYQIANDSGSGDIVNDPPYLVDSLPNQSTATLSQLILSSLTSTVDNYYTGWWIKIFTGTNINQVRQITSYNGSQHVATLNAPFTTQKPSSGDTVYFYNFSYVSNYYDEVADTFSLSYVQSDPGVGSIVNKGNADLRLKRLYASDTTVSTNITTGSIYTIGSIAISNTNNSVSSTNGGTITSAGGVGIRKNLIVGDNIGVGTTGFVPQESLHIRKTTGDNNSNSSIRLENDHSAFSYIDFVENGASNRYGIVLDSTNNIFNLTNTSLGVIPPLANSALTVNASGYVGINATSDVVSPLAIRVNNFISTNSSTGYLGLIGGSTNINGNTVGSRVLLKSNPIGGDLQLYAGNAGTTNGNINLYTGNDIKAVNVDNKGIVNVLSTQPTKNNTSGALVVTGGVCIKCTENATSLSSGGALAVNGGAYIDKNLYLGGDLFITGALNASGSVTSPAITFVGFNNCTLDEYYNNNLILISNAAIFTVGISLYPSSASSDCEFEFELPGRGNAFAKRFEVITNVTGYTDDTNITILYNVLGFGIVGSNSVRIKFQSVSTSLHYFQIQCQYILA